MANNFPCNKHPVKFVNCCQVMDCIDIKSSDNSVTVEKDECGVDVTITGNNLDNILQINDGDCITFLKEFIDGKLHITPQIDWACVAENVCELCQPPVCPAPIALSGEVFNDEEFMLLNDSDSMLINSSNDSLIL